MVFGSNKYYVPEKAPYYHPEKDGKVAVITGGNSGIGFNTIVHLYLHGYKVYMLGRNEQRCKKAIEDIKKEAAKRESEYTAAEKKQRFTGSVQWVVCDLMNLKSVEAAANTVKSKEPKLDLLINNAGILGVPFEHTQDGIESIYQVNVTSHVLLTLQLLPLLKKAAAPRVVSVASFGHTMSLKYQGDNSNLKGSGHLNGMYRYGSSKLGLIHFTKALAKKHPEIVCVAVHPGVILTGLYDSTYASFALFQSIARIGMYLSTVLVAVSNEVGCYATLRGAWGEKPAENGSYFTTGGIPATPSKLARNEEYIQQTWDINVKHLKDRGFAFES